MKYALAGKLKTRCKESVLHPTSLNSTPPSYEYDATVDALEVLKSIGQAIAIAVPRHMSGEGVRHHEANLRSMATWERVSMHVEDPSMMFFDEPVSATEEKSTAATAVGGTLTADSHATAENDENNDALLFQTSLSPSLSPNDEHHLHSIVSNMSKRNDDTVAASSGRPLMTEFQRRSRPRSTAVAQETSQHLFKIVIELLVANWSQLDPYANPMRTKELLMTYWVWSHLVCLRAVSHSQEDVVMQHWHDALSGFSDNSYEKTTEFT